MVVRFVVFLIGFVAYASASFAETFLHIGSPEDIALTQAQSKGQVLLVTMRLLQCADDHTKDTINHISCGEDGAVVLYEEKGTMREGSDKIFQQRKPLQLAYTRPEVMFGKQGYTIEAVPESRLFETQVHIAVTLSKVIKKHVLASLVVTEDRVKMADVMVYFNGKEFVNPAPVPFRRMMTARQKFKLGETHTLTGDMWVEIPYEEEQTTLSGERQRLFLELTVK